MLNRLLKKRPLVFNGRENHWRLRLPYQNFITGNLYIAGTGLWETIGKDDEQEPLTMKNYLTYNELELSSFLSLSVYTPFLNQCTWQNYSHHEEFREIEGVAIGQVGARFEDVGNMEWKYIIIDPNQNRKENGYDHMREYTRWNSYKMPNGTI